MENFLVNLRLRGLVAIVFFCCFWVKGENAPNVHVVNSVLQQQIVTGVVSDESGQPLPGVTVIVKGTSKAAQTDFDGKYRINAAVGTTLVFSYVGMEKQEVVASRSKLNVTMKEQTSQIDEVVVTALGIKRKAKALGHSVTEVKGEALTKVIDVNPMNALQGQVAGVNISGNATGGAGSTRIIIRGNTSLTGNNQPLYVIDGIPMGNDNNGSAGMWGGSDGGDGISSLNPNEIASISVLKGAAAAALYGSRAAGGVILVTTKTGKVGQGLGVEYSSSVQFNQINNDILDFQQVYGQGIRGTKPANEAEAFDNAVTSWGAKLDGKPAINWDGKQRPYSSVGSNADKFYRTGTTLVNSLAVSNANEKMNYRLSATRTTFDDIIPFSNLQRNMFGLNIGSNLGSKLRVDASIKYNIENTNNRPRLSDSPGNVNYAIMSLPVNVDVTTQKPGIGPDKKELRTSNNTYTQNPYWASEYFKNFDERHRVIAHTAVRYDVWKGIYLFGRAGTDQYTRKATSIEPWGTAYKPLGGMNENERRYIQTDMDLMLGYDATFFDKISIKSVVGGNQNYVKRETVSANGQDFIVPSVESVKNTNAQSTGYSFSERAINGLYGSLELSYGEYAFFTVTARNDWFSTLSQKGKTTPNDQFYYSANASLILSDMFNIGGFIDVLKLRGGYSQIAGGAPSPYSLSLNYEIFGQGHSSQALGRISNGSVPNADLRPYQIGESEVGLDIRLFNNRFGLDVAYYDKITENDIVTVAASRTSGYGGSIDNLGSLTNKGWEVLLNLRPIQTKDFSWDTSVNFTYNEGKVVKTNNSNSSISLGEARSRNVQIRHIPGEAYGVIWGVGYDRDKNGNIIYELDADGNVRAKRGDYKILGQGVQPITAGFTNTFKYKGLSLAVLIDGKFGGQIYSGTNAGALSRGQHKKTLNGREGGLTISGQREDGDDSVAFTRTLSPDNDNLRNYWARESEIAEATIYDADFLRLRQVRLGYNVPKKFLGKFKIKEMNVALIAKNLFFLHRKTENIDPESAYNTGNAQGLEYYGVPATRSYGLSVNFKF